MADPHARAVFDAWFARTGDHREAARRAGVSERTGRRWRTRADPELRSPPPLPLVDPVGRDDDLQILERWTREPGLVALTGPGGVGKTVLALALAHRWVARGGRAWFCDLSAAGDPVGACHAVAEPLGTPLGPLRSLDEAVAAVARELAGLGEALVVLDGVETLDPAAVAAWRTGRVRLVVTSRRTLGLRDEREHRVAGLAPDAVRKLLVRRCGALEGLDALVPLLDGLPLAIELAAARARTVPVEVLVALLGAHPAALGEGPADLPTRHRSMERVVAGSWALTDPDERAALSAWSSFVAPFDARAAAGVAGVDPAVGVDLLERVHRQSLVERVGSRYRMYGAIRDFVHRQAPADPDALQRHTELVLAGHPRERPLDPAAVEALELHRGDLLAIAGRGGASGLRAALALAPLYTIRGPTAELPTLLERAVRGSTDPALRAVAHDARAQALLTLGRSPEAAAALDLALAQAREAGDRRLEGRVLLCRGVAAQFGWRFDEAEQTLLSALEFLEEAGDVGAIGRALSNLGVTRYWRGDFAGARVRLGEALAAHRRASDPSSAANTLALLGALHHAPPNQERARGYYREALATFEAFGDRRRAAAVQAGLALVDLEAGDLERARAGFDRALDGFARAGHSSAGYQYRGFRGVAHHLSGRTALARADYADAVAAARGAGDLRHEALFLATSGVLDRSPGALDQAVLLAGQVGDPAFVALIGRLADGSGGDDGLEGPPELRIVPRLVSAGQAPLRIVGPTIETPEGLVVDLRRRTAARRLVDRLVAERVARPGAAVSVDALFDAGWPGQRIAPASAANRVHVALSALRSAGLRPVLQSVDAGFRLDPQVPVEVSELSGPTLKRD